MKRNQHIVPLSRDHHLALLLCWKIRRGMARGISLERIRSYIIYFWNGHLNEHFQQEERLLFEGVDDPLCRQAIEEHRQIEHLIASIGGEGAWVAENYGQFADMLERHIRFEERQLFPFLEKTLSEERLSEVGTELLRLHEQPAADSYEDQFWN